MFFKKFLGKKDNPEKGQQAEDKQKPKTNSEKNAAPQTKISDKRPQTFQNTNEFTVIQNSKVPQNTTTLRLESFADLMGDLDDQEEAKDVFNNLNTDLTASMRSAKNVSRVRVYNRIGTVLPDAFLGDVMSMRDQEIKDLDHNSYFEVQRTGSRQENNPSQQDFIDSFFTKKTETEDQAKPLPANKSEKSHNSFEIVDDDSSVTYVPDIKALNKIIEQSTTTQKEDISPASKEAIILLKSTTPLNDTTASSEIIKSDQLGGRSQEVGSSSSQNQSNQKQSSEFVASSNSGSNMNSTELQNSSSNTSSELQRSESLPTVIYSDFENRPTAQFVKQEDFIVEFNQHQVEEEQIDFVPKIFLKPQPETILIMGHMIPTVAEKEEIQYEEIKVEECESPIDLIDQKQPIEADSQYEQNQNLDQIQQPDQQQQEEEIELQEQKEQLDIGFELSTVQEIEAPIERLESIPSSFLMNGLPSDTYFDRKRIYETSITEGSYTVPVVQRRVALPNLARVTKNLDQDPVETIEESTLNPATPTQLEIVKKEIVQTPPIVQVISSLEKKVSLQQRPVSSGLPLPVQNTNADLEGFLNRQDTPVVRQAFREPKKDKKQLLIEQMRLAEPEVKEQNSSESNLTDKSFIECASLDSEEIEFALQVQEQRAALEDQYFLNDLQNYQDNNNFDFKQDSSTEQTGNAEDEQEDFLKVISEYEIAYKVHSDAKYQDLRKKNSQFLKSSDSSLQKVLSEPESIPGGVNKLLGPYEKKTCISVQDSYILVGTNQGNLYAFSKETGILLGTHKEDGKEFIENPITCVDFHLNRTKYAVIGYQKGQIALIDLTEIKKTVKLIKDHHKKPIVSVKFCDWAKEKPHYTMGKDHKCNDCNDVKAWMFVSIDTDGKVVVNTVTNISFGLLYANDFIINDPTKFPEHLKYEGASAGFSSKRYPSDASTDNSTVIALACSECVVIRVLGEKSQDQRMFLKKPFQYPSENLGRFQENKDRLPVLAWGYGKTPMFNFQVFPLLAIGWGPIIQIVVLRDINGDNSQSEDFQLDGYYIIAQSTSAETQEDLTICSLQFIDESLLVAVTKSGEVRVMLTEKFKESSYTIEPSSSLEELDSRCKYLVNGTPLTTKQSEVEMERITRLETSLENSMYGISSAQVCSVWMDKLYFLGDDQRVYTIKHMKWLENLLVVNQIAREGAWIEVCSRALNIYTGRLKGLRIEGETEQAKKEKMRTQLKTFIETLVSQTIAQFRTQTTLTKETVADNCALLIRVVIEFSIEIGEPVFLFEALQDQLKRAGLENEFSSEIKPYILAGTFSECIIPEKVLEEGILRNFKKIMRERPEENLAENFEKVLLNLRFDSCSKKYLEQLITLCHEYKFATGIIHVSLCCYANQGPMHALSELRDFYLDVLTRENENKESFQPSLEEIYQVNTLPQTSNERARIEQCSAYIGLKLLWTTRYFLLGKKVPRGIFTNNQWHVLCHDVLDFITQHDMIDLFMRIDAAAYFQIISIAFNNPSTQFTAIEKGRPFQKEPYEALTQTRQSDQIEDNNPPLMTHESIVKRISGYFQEQDVSNILGNETSQMRLYYLCFIASICGQYQQSPEEENNGRLYFEVALELLRHSNRLIGFNKSLLQRRMTNKLMYRRLSKAGNIAPDDQKHLVLTEEMLLMLVQRARPELTDQKCLTQILEAVERTNFSDVKLVLYDLNNDYSNCMRLFMSNERQKPTLSVKTNKGEIDGFEWIQNRYLGLETRAHEDVSASQQLQNFRREIFSQAFYLVKANTMKTIQLCEAIFKSAHLEIIENMQGEQHWQLVYIQHLIEIKREDIKRLISGHTPGARKAGDFEKWRTILSMHVRLICILEPSRVTPEIEKIVKDNFYPMEDCLKTCFEFKQLEACALIHKKLGHYSEAIELYLKVMANGLNVEQLKKELFYYNKDRQKHVDRERQRLTDENKARLSQDIRKTPDLKLIQLLIQNAVKTVVQIARKDKLQDHYLAWVSKFGKNLELMDRVMDRIQGICRSHPKEVLETKDNEVCMHVLQALFGILFHPSVRRKGYCKRQMKIKIVTFCRSTLEYISFGRLLQVATSNNKNLKYKAIKELVNEVFCDKTQEIEMCMTVQSNAQSDLRFYQNLTIRDKGTGVAFTQDSLTCGICQLSVSELKFKSSLVLHSKSNDLVVFDCSNAKLERHACHARCLKKMIQDEQQNDSKKVQLSEKAIVKLFRCPSCNPKNQFVLFSQEKTEESIEVESVLDPILEESEDMSAPSSRRTLRLKPSTAEQKLIQKHKNLRKLEETLMLDECLTRGDFRLD